MVRPVKGRGNPVRIRRVEMQYAGKLRKVAEQVGMIVRSFPYGDMAASQQINNTMARYAEALTQWATRSASDMLMEVALRDQQAWMQSSKDMSLALRNEIRNAPTGEVMRMLLADQVTLIKSIPTDAAKRVHELTLASIENSGRAKEIALEIGRSGEVATSRANLIAITEVSRTASTLTEARAQHIGSTHYIWRTVGDSDVRPGHRAMNGKVCEWANPPAVNEGTPGRPHIMYHHAGRIWRCRCYPEPILPEA